MLTCALQTYTKMFSMPNREQFQEGEESTDESGDWQSPDDNEVDSDDSEGSEMADSPPAQNVEPNNLKIPQADAAK